MDEGPSTMDEGTEAVQGASAELKFKLQAWRSSLASSATHHVWYMGSWA